MKFNWRIWVLVSTMLAALPGSSREISWPQQSTNVTTPTAAKSSHEQIIKIVTQIKRADYEGDRSTLKRLYGELAPVDTDKQLGSRIRYWRGFALWRRAINGFNDNVDVKEQSEDLKQAWDEFNESAKLDLNFADAKIAALSCVSLLGFSVKEKDPARVQELLVQARQLRKDAAAIDPDNPRLAWVMGPNLWYAPPERGGGQAKAMEMYETALATIRKSKPSDDPLQPSWGEPELLMNLAWSDLNKTAQDVNAAEQNARAALAIVPYWHYVRDILMKQIQDARAKKPA